LTVVPTGKEAVVDTNATGRGATVFPFLRYQDAQEAIGWLAKAFGFEKRAVYPGPDGTISYAELSVGEGIVMLSSAKDDALGMKSPLEAGAVSQGIVMLSSAKDDALGMKSPLEAGAVSQGIYVYVDDADAHFESAKAAGADIAMAIHDTDYGSREYAARDPEGHLWSFGTYIPGRTSEA
jgi:uncharacterized glyoxalase superfamily protein PhnB